MSLLKIHKVIPWKNRTEPAINEKNLSQIDNELDTLDDRIICLDTEKLSAQTAGNFITSIEINSADGVIKVTYYSGRTVTYDTNLEKIPLNYRFDEETQILYFIADDGTEQICNLSSLISQYEFVDSNTITFAIDAAGKVTANIKRGSITEDLLQPNFLADVRVEAAKALSGAEAAEISAMEAAGSAETAASAAAGAEASAGNASASAMEAAGSAETAASAAAGAEASAGNASASAMEAAGSAEAAASAAAEAEASAGNASASAMEAAGSAEAAASAAAEADTSAGNAAASAAQALNSAGIAQNYGETVQEIYKNIQAGSVTGVKGAKEDVFRKGDVVITPENIGALPVDGDSAENTVSFTSADVVSSSGWTDVPVLSSGEQHSSIFSKISAMFRNVRYLWKLLGSTDISAIGDGTVTGAIDAINGNLDGCMPLSGGELTQGGIISPYGDLYMQSNGYDGWLSEIMDYIKSERNIKTYTTLAQVGFTEPTTTAEIYAAMPSQSQALLIDTVVSDAPTDGGGATMLFVKQSTHRGFILASGKTSMTYIMHLNGVGGNPTGEWIPIPMYKPGKITVFATPIYYTQVDGKYEWSVAVNSPVFPADSTKIAVTALDIYGVAYITSPSYEIIENNGSGSLLIKFMFDNQRQASTWRIYFNIS